MKLSSRANSRHNPPKKQLKCGKSSLESQNQDEQSHPNLDEHLPQHFSKLEKQARSQKFEKDTKSTKHKKHDSVGKGEKHHKYGKQRRNSHRGDDETTFEIHSSSESDSEFKSFDDAETVEQARNRIHSEVPELGVYSSPNSPTSSASPSSKFRKSKTKTNKALENTHENHSRYPSSLHAKKISKTMTTKLAKKLRSRCRHRSKLDLTSNPDFRFNIVAQLALLDSTHDPAVFTALGVRFPNPKITSAATEALHIAIGTTTCYGLYTNGSNAAISIAADSANLLNTEASMGRCIAELREDPIHVQVHVASHSSSIRKTSLICGGLIHRRWSIDPSAFRLDKDIFAPSFAVQDLDKDFENRTTKTNDESDMTQVSLISTLDKLQKTLPHHSGLLLKKKLRCVVLDSLH